MSANQRSPNCDVRKFKKGPELPRSEWRFFSLTSAENSVKFAGKFLQGRWALFKAHRWAAVQNRLRLGLAGLNRAIVAKGRSAVQPAGSPGFETPPAAEGYSTGSWCRTIVWFLNFICNFFFPSLSVTQTMLLFSNLHKSKNLRSENEERSSTRCKNCYRSKGCQNGWLKADFHLPTTNITYPSYFPVQFLWRRPRCSPLC